VELLATVPFAEVELFKADKEELSAAVEFARHIPVLLAQIMLVEFANEVLLAASTELLEDPIVELERYAVLLRQIALEFANKELLAESIELLEDPIVKLEGHAVLLGQIALEFINEVLFTNKVLLAAANVLLHKLAVLFLICLQS
jgi:hypothetical protein